MRLRIPKQGDTVVLNDQVDPQLIGYVYSVGEYDTEHDSFHVFIVLSNTREPSSKNDVTGWIRRIPSKDMWYVYDITTPLEAKEGSNVS